MNLFCCEARKFIGARLILVLIACLLAASGVVCFLGCKDDALKTVLGVPRVFLPLVLKGCVDWARENGVTLITEEHMKIINDKRSKEKSGK